MAKNKNKQTTLSKKKNFFKSKSNCNFSPWQRADPCNKQSKLIRKRPLTQYKNKQRIETTFLITNLSKAFENAHNNKNIN